MAASADATGPVLVIGQAIHVPGWSATQVPDAGDLLDLPGVLRLPQLSDLPAVPETACPAESAHKVLGRKGLLGKDPATRLALCATHRMLGLPPGRPTRPLPGAGDTAVVVSSNLGNVASVCSVVDEVRARSVRSVSPLEAPNASSNVIASTIAIWYGFTGPNVTICNGATSGLDAVEVASRLLRAGRARRAVVVGVESADEVASRFAATVDMHSRLVSGAAALLLARDCTVAGVALGSVTHHSAAQWPAPRRGGSRQPPVCDMYGADGVVRAAVAAALLGWPTVQAPSSVLVTCGDPDDGYASAWLHRNASAAQPVRWGRLMAPSRVVTWPGGERP